MVPDILLNGLPGLPKPLLALGSPRDLIFKLFRCCPRTVRLLPLCPSNAGSAGSRASAYNLLLTSLIISIRVGSLWMLLLLSRVAFHWLTFCLLYLFTSSPFFFVLLSSFALSCSPP